METISDYPFAGQARDTTIVNHPDEPESAFDKFVARQLLQDANNILRAASRHPAAQKLERYLLECSERGEDRYTLGYFARAQLTETFVATVAGRGFCGKHRTVLITDLRIFGSRFVYEEHLWLPYNRHWKGIEPFYQGQKVVLVGTAIEYTRKDATHDYTLAIEKVTKL